MAASNILVLIMENVSPQVLARIASMLGIDRMVAEKAMGAAVPAVLSGIARAVGRPDGVRQLSNALGKEPSGMLDNLANALGGPNQQSMLTTGGSILSSLLGSGGTKTITDAVSRYAGVAPGQAANVTNLAGLLAASGLGKVQRDTGLDTNGVAQMLTSQAPQIAAAMPPGFSDVLRSAETPRTDTTYTRPAEEVRRTPARTAGGAASPLPNWLYWALGLLAILGLAWLLQPMFNRPQVATTPPPAKTVTIPPAVQPVIAVGTPIYSSDGERLGDVIEVVLGPNSAVEGVRLDVGSPLGIGPKTVNVTNDKLERRGDRVVTKMTAAEARALPAAPATTK